MAPSGGDPGPEAAGGAGDEPFRQRVRAWLEPALADFWRSHDPDRMPAAELGLAWERRLYRDGWAAPAWPREYGGMGLSLPQQVVYYEELARHGAPEETNRPGKRTFAPTLLQYGTDAQRRRYLPPLLSADEVWCQGFSEPGAGSDLAAIRTTALPEGDRLRIDGQKIWSSNAEFADFMFALVRTEPGSARQAGLSLVVIAMGSPGVEVRPITKITGDSDFAEVFLTDVRVPVDNVVGPLHQGWSVAMDALSSERTINIVPRVVDMARHVTEAERDLADLADGELHARLRRARVAADVLSVACYRSVSTSPDQLALHGSFLKLAWSEASQQFLRTVVDALARDHAQRVPARVHQRWRHRYLTARAQTLYAGTSEIQRNVIAKRGLRLAGGADTGEGDPPCGWL